MADLETQGTTITLRDMALYPDGALELSVGANHMMAILRQVGQEFAAQGFETLPVTGQRLSGANPGRAVDLIIDPTKYVR